MLLLRANPKGGRPIKAGHFPLHQDKDGNFGYLIGYREDGEKVLIPLHLAEQIANTLGNHTSAFRTLTSKLQPKLPWKEWIFIKFFGRKELNNLREVYREEIGD